MTVKCDNYWMIAVLDKTVIHNQEQNETRV